MQRVRIRGHLSRENTPIFTKILLHPISVVIVVCASLFISYTLWQASQAIRGSEKRLDGLKENVAQEEQRGQELLEKLKKIESPFEKERIFRDELGMQKPEETVIQVGK